LKIKWSTHQLENSLEKLFVMQVTLRAYIGNPVIRLLV